LRVSTQTNHDLDSLSFLGVFPILFLAVVGPSKRPCTLPRAGDVDTMPAL